MSTVAEVQAGLEHVLEGAWGVGGVEVRDVVRLSGGASRQTWSLMARRPDGAEERLVLQRTASTGLQTAAAGREAALLREAASQGVPVPEVVAASGDGFGRLDEAGEGAEEWVLARHVEGETLARRILRDDAFAAARTSLTAQCGEALAGIHRMRTDGIPGLFEMYPAERYRQVLDMLNQPHPVFELALRWLQEHQPTARPDTLVHGDFRLGNLIIDSDGLRAVLDWELPHIGNPVEDLGWLCVRAWRFGGGRPVAGVGEREELLAAYAAAGGSEVALEELRWWEVSGTLAWGVICIVQADRHRSGGERSVELAAIGRRVCENEWDLCRLLQPDLVHSLHETAEPRSEPFPNGPHDVPSVPELLEAVRGYLDDTARPLLEGRPAFHARVASNALAIVQREWELGAGQAAAHRQRLHTLGYSTDEELTRAIREGELAGREEEVWEAVTAAAHDKLQVANPSYADRP